MSTPTPTHLVNMTLYTADCGHDLLIDAVDLFQDKNAKIKGFYLDSSWMATTPVEGSSDVLAPNDVRAVLIVMSDALTYKQIGDGLA